MNEKSRYRLVFIIIVLLIILFAIQILHTIQIKQIFEIINSK